MPPWPLFAIVAGIALVSRILAAILLPNAEQDGYSYAEIIAQLTQFFQHWRLRASDLYGFWLPLFQIIAAILNLGVHDPIIAGKIVNVVCGAVATVLVFDLTRLLTNNLVLALITFTVIVADPLHILYSAACMTDVPHGCLVLLSLWFACRWRWTAASLTGALAGCMRIESWALLLVLPILQLICERRLSILSIVILLIPPIGWLAITFFATGHPLTYFHDRAEYHVEYIAFHPERRGVHPAVIGQDIASFLLGAGKVITIAALGIGAMTIWKWLRTHRTPNAGLMITIGYYAGLLGLIVVAYVTKSQPVILPRYGLTFFAVGLPLFALALQSIISRLSQSWLKPAFILFIALFLLTEVRGKISTVSNVREDFHAHQTVATALAREMAKSPSARCFSDDVAVRVLSSLPPERFVRTTWARRNGVATAESFVAYLNSQDVQFLVYFPTEDSLPVKFFPQLGGKGSAEDSSFEFLEFAESNFGPDIWLYRLR
jgi:hypothetical protein